MEGDDNKPPNCLGALWTVVGGDVDKIVVIVDAEMKCKSLRHSSTRKRNSINGLARSYRPKLTFINRCSFFVYCAL